MNNPERHAYCDEHKNMETKVTEIHSMVKGIQAGLLGTEEKPGLFEITRRQESRWKIVTKILWGVVAAVVGIVAKMVGSWIGGDH